MGLPKVQALMQSLVELGRANESIASTSFATTSFIINLLIIYCIEKNLALQEGLYRLRAETQQAFDEAKGLEARWKVVEREQRELHQVCYSPIAAMDIYVCD